MTPDDPPHPHRSIVTRFKRLPHATPTAPQWASINNHTPTTPKNSPPPLPAPSASGPLSSWPFGLPGLRPRSPRSLWPSAPKPSAPSPTASWPSAPKPSAPKPSAPYDQSPGPSPTQPTPKQLHPTIFRAFGPEALRASRPSAPKPAPTHASPNSTPTHAHLPPAVSQNQRQTPTLSRHPKDRTSPSPSPCPSHRVWYADSAGRLNSVPRG
jgi:hypothetical protein